MAPNDIAKWVLPAQSVDLAEPFATTIRRAVRNSKARVKVSGAPASQLPELKPSGCFTDLVQYRTQVFVPVDGATDVINRLLS